MDQETRPQETEASAPAAEHRGALRPSVLVPRIRELVRAIGENDEATVQEAVLRLSRSRRWLAPLALAVGAVTMLFQGLRLVFSNWRLMMIQILPAMWIWLAMLDLKVHVLHGKSFNVIRGPIVIVIVLVIIAITAASFYLNAVLAFAIGTPGPPAIRPAVAKAREHLGVVLGSGAFVGLLLGLSTMIVTRSGRPWFALSLSAVIGVMMICYVAVPSRLIGIKPKRSRRDKLVASAVSGALGAAVCTPPYVIGRIGILMLGTRALLIPGIILITFGFALQAGAAGAVKAIKLSVSLVAGSDPPAQAAVVSKVPQ
jgi:hypothetical protein